MKQVWRWAKPLIIIAAANVLIGSAYASLCVWVNPDRDIKTFYPGADSYSTDIKKFTSQQEIAIEKRIGSKLDPDENEFKFYRVKKQGRVAGTVLSHQARGKYGAVQTVIAIGNDGRIIGVHVQRHREPTNLNQDSFLNQFRGKTPNDPIAVGNDIQAIPGYDQSSQAVAFSVKKILVIFDVLGR